VLSVAGEWQKRSEDFEFPPYISCWQKGSSSVQEWFMCIGRRDRYLCFALTKSNKSVRIPPSNIKGKLDILLVNSAFLRGAKKTVCFYSGTNGR